MMIWKQIDPSRGVVELGLHLALFAKGAFGRGQDRRLEGFDQDLALDILVFSKPDR